MPLSAGRPTRIPTAILISGRGSNMAALIEAAAHPSYPASIRLVVSNRRDAAGLAIASAHGIATCVVPHSPGQSREVFDDNLNAVLKQHGIALVALAGFMRLLGPAFCQGWAGRLVNIHPSLLPSFKGLDTHARALAAGVKVHGCTVHHVVVEMDAGAIIGQAAVPVFSHDTADLLAARVLRAEHRLYPVALARIAAQLTNATVPSSVPTDEADMLLSL